MRYMVSAILESVVEFQDNFNINEVRFLKEDGIKIAQVEVEAEYINEAQFKALGEFHSAFGAIALIAKHYIDFEIKNIIEITPNDQLKMGSDQILISVEVPKKLTQQEINTATENHLLIQDYPVIKDVFRMINSGNYNTWVTMYKIYEIIDRDAGIKKNQWISEKNRNRFKRSANHPAVSGLDARHGFQKEDPPENPMTLVEARELIDNLIFQWLDYYKK